MKVLLVQPRGFCRGVDRGLKIVEVCLMRFGHPVYLKHQIVHNRFVTEDLKSKGALTVESVDEVPPGAVVVFSTHGSSPDDYLKAKSRNLKVIDGTCPLVTRIHNKAKRYSREGRKIILVGHRGHQEVEATMGWAPMILVDPREELSLPKWDSRTPVVLLTQTTLSVEDTQRVTERVKHCFSNAIVLNDICYATSNRQLAVKDVIARGAQVVLVVGTWRESSNTRRLQEVAVSAGGKAYLLDSVAELRGPMLQDAKCIGITSGASTPEHLVKALISHLQDSYSADIEEVITMKERGTFVLPRELR